MMRKKKMTQKEHIMRLMKRAKKRINAKRSSEDVDTGFSDLRWVIGRRRQDLFVAISNSLIFGIGEELQ